MVKREVQVGERKRRAGLAANNGEGLDGDLGKLEVCWCCPKVLLPACLLPPD